jgi:hypothetical protein
MASLHAVYLTEKQASEKWCPLVRRAGSYGNSDADGGRRAPRCIGSACMAWRKHGQIGLTPEGKKVDRDMDGRTRWTDIGYCGAFGHPDPQ